MQTGEISFAGRIGYNIKLDDAKQRHYKKTTFVPSNLYPSGQPHNFASWVGSNAAGLPSVSDRHTAFFVSTLITRSNKNLVSSNICDKDVAVNSLCKNRNVFEAQQGCWFGCT
jgi:hypothetical protein